MAKADPASCRVCQRVGGLCLRHGGPSRSTAFRGKGGLGGEQCSRCRWPLGRGHAATCPVRGARAIPASRSVEVHPGDQEAAKSEEVRSPW
jgi:hypothetical protein